MSDNPTLIDNPCIMVVPPNVQAMITGVRFARIFPSGVCQLTYTDGNTESANLTLEQLTEARQDFFRLVSHVQAARGPSTR